MSVVPAKRLLKRLCGFNPANVEKALFRGYTKPEWKPIVTRSPVHIEAVLSEGPEAVIGDRCQKTHERASKSQAQEPYLPPMGVAGKDQVPLAFG